VPVEIAHWTVVAHDVEQQRFTLLETDTLNVGALHSHHAQESLVLQIRQAITTYEFGLDSSTSC
jgi:hypothetical protein